MRKIIGLAFIGMMAIGCGASRPSTMRPEFNPAVDVEAPVTPSSTGHTYEIEKAVNIFGGWGIATFSKEYPSDAAVLEAYKLCAYKITRDDGVVIWESDNPTCSSGAPKKKHKK